MISNVEFGKQGEDVACALLKEKGYAILEMNWRFGKYEVDIIALYKKQLVIIEVKTRSTLYFGEPALFVTKDKQRFLIKAAQAYVLKRHLDVEVRFDIISIVMGNGKEEINHIEDAFYPVVR